MNRRILAALHWTGLLAWAAGILWLSSLRPDEMPPGAFLMWDKFNHFIAFAAGGWLAAGALQTANPSRSIRHRLVWAIAIVAGFGMADELIQLLTPGRSGADFYDWIADFLGAAAGASLTLWTHARLDRFFPRP